MEFLEFFENLLEFSETSKTKFYKLPAARFQIKRVKNQNLFKRLILFNIPQN